MQKKQVDIDYSYFDADFHDDMLKSKNPVRKWFHTNKNKILSETVMKYYKNGDKIVDLGCGTVNWNLHKLPVYGVDLNLKMLQKAKKAGKLYAYSCSPVEKTIFDDNSVNIVVISEVLEHLENYREAIKEIKRILVKGGVCISTVPYDTFFSMWKPLFALQCFVHGTMLGNEYFKNEAGHINHFSPKSIANVFQSEGFEIISQFDMSRFTIFTVARKIT
jgi:ubiquinone/menaquinone biosynthesis C-methylase UbiE